MWETETYTKEAKVKKLDKARHSSNISFVLKGLTTHVKNKSKKNDKNDMKNEMPV